MWVLTGIKTIYSEYFLEYTKNYSGGYFDNIQFSILFSYLILICTTIMYPGYNEKCIW